MRAGAVAALVVLLAAAWPGPAPATIVSTKHNLSASGPGSIRATSEPRICVFCHTPHNARPEGPLWNRRMPGLSYTPYESSTIAALPGQPTGASLMCLSCHDGTIALGDVLSREEPISMIGTAVLPVGPSRLGTDLGDDHPVSFDYTAHLAGLKRDLVLPGNLSGPVRLDARGQLQCTSCHDPHENAFGKFLVKPSIGGELCETCHQPPYWSSATHKISGATWNGVAPDPWPRTDFTTVSANACRSCHQPHSAPGREWLLNSPVEEDNCRPCHNGNVASKDIMRQFRKFSIHPVTETIGVHDAGEAPIVRARHVECADCHNPHAVQGGGSRPPGALRGVRGVSIGGTPVSEITDTYQACLRCHGDSPGKAPPLTPRQIVQTNVRLEFATTNPSFHPVAGPGRNPNVPSLKPPLTTASVIDCIDCHNNDTGPGAGGGGPAGPHGSRYEPLLERRYERLVGTTESPDTYALCYKCHDRNSILGNESFPYHQFHVAIYPKAPCNVCHGPHGISGSQGNPTNNAHLINFDVSVVSPVDTATGPRLEYESLGRFEGRCWLSCHGTTHKARTYKQ